MKICAGLWAINQFPLEYQEIDAQNVYINTNYTGEGTYSSNIAIIILQREFKLTYHINVICLPKQDDVFEAKTNCFGTGWGNDEYSSTVPKPLTAIMKRIRHEIWDKTDALQEFSNQGIVNKVEFSDSESLIWAGGIEGHVLCKFDDGAPLACPKPDGNNYYLAGIYVSPYLEACKDNLPGISIIN